MSIRPYLLLVTISLAMLGTNSVVLLAHAAKDKAKVRFSCMMWDQPPAEELFYRDGDKFLPLEFHAAKRSAPYPLKSSQAFGLYRRLAAAEDDKPPYQLVGSAPLIAGADRMLFIIFQAGEDPSPKYKVLGIDDSLKAFPAGTFRFINFSPSLLQVKFGGKVEKIPPRKMTVIKSNVSPQGGFLPFIIGDTEGRVVFETRLFGQPAGREMVFISPPGKPGGAPKVKFLPQIVSPPE